MKAGTKAGTKALRSLTKSERDAAIRYAVQNCGSVPSAARMLGISVRTLQRWVRADPFLGVGARGRGRRKATRADPASPP